MVLIEGLMWDRQSLGRFRVDSGGCLPQGPRSLVLPRYAPLYNRPNTLTQSTEATS